MLLFFDGFDHGEGIGGGSVWDPTGDGYWYDGFLEDYPTLGPRTGIGVLDVWGEQETKALPASSGFVIGVAMLALEDWGADWLTTIDFIRIREGTTTHLSLAGDGTGRLRVKCGVTVLATGAQVLVPDTWYYVEFRGVIADAGSFDVRIDGVLDMTGNGDTRNGGATGQWNIVSLNGEDHFFDDLYVCDRSGSVSNDFLGPSRVQTLTPVPDAVAMGSNRGLVPYGGTDHGAMVDDPRPNSTDFNTSAIVGAKDTYRLTLPTAYEGLGPIGVQTHLWAAKAVAGVGTVCPVLRVGGVDVDGPSINPTVNFLYYTYLWDVVPTAAQVSTMEAGMKIVS